MKLKKHCSHYKKCLKCGKVFGFILKAPNVNSCLTEKDILNIIIMNTENPLETGWCENCQMDTIQMSVGWDYKDLKNK